MADIRVVVQVNALERMILVEGKTEYIGEDFWNANVQNVLYPFWTSDNDRLIHLNYFSDGSYGIEKKKYVYDRATKERKWKTYQWREPTEAEVGQIAETLKEKYFEYQDTEQEIIQEKLYNEYGRWNKVSWEGIKMIRNFLLSDCDWTQMPDAPIEATLKAQWTAYRQKLREIPQDYDGQDADDVKFPMNPIAYAKWVTYIDVNGDALNESKAYLDTDDQYGMFLPQTIGEFAKRIVHTIASNYRIKNPATVYPPADKIAQFKGDTQAELDDFLEMIGENDV